MKKRVISTIVAFTFICGTLTPIQAEAGTGRNAEKRDSAAQTVITTIATPATLGTTDGSSAKVTKDDAKTASMKALKDYMGLEVDEKTFQCNIQYTQDYGMSSRNLWVINWYSYNNQKNINSSVSIDATSGKIVAINNNEFSNNQNPKGVIKTQKEAKKLAEAFINKINPEEFKQMEYVDEASYNGIYGNYRDTNYIFRYVRKVNGINYEGNYISVGVDGTTGKVNNYNYYWEDIASFPTLDGVIGNEKALDAYKKAMTFKLYYTSVRNPKDGSGKVTETKLAYQPDYGNFSLVNAKTGGLLDWQGAAPTEMVKKDLSAAEKAELLKSVQPLKNLDKELDNDGATKLGKAYIQELFGDGYDIQNLNYSDSETNWYEGHGKSIWSIQFTKASTSPMMNNGGNIVIEAKTGAIVGLYMYNAIDEASLKENFVPSVSWEQGYTKAIALLKAKYSDKLDKISTEQTKIDMKNYVNGRDIGTRSYYYTFTRMVNGIPYAENNISITIDAATGKATQMNCAWDDNMQFPAAEKIITPEAAGKVYFDNFKPVLSYTSTAKQDGKSKDEVYLAYLLKNDKLSIMPATIDALTGTLLGFTGQPLTPDKNSFDSLIKGNKYERELTILAFQGVIDKNNFVINKAIKKVDFLKMLVNTRGQMYMGPGSENSLLKFTNVDKTNEYYRILQQAVAMGLIENKAAKIDLKATLSREEMAKLLVKFIQLDKVANAKGIFKLSYADAAKISKASYGSVAICKGMGVFENSKQFRPKDKATTVEAALAIYKALKVIK